VLRELAEVIGRRYIAGWGMTEISGGIGTATTVPDLRSPGQALNFFASVGRPVPDTVIEIVDELGELLPHDGETVGELILYSSSVMRGYWNDPEATERAIRGGWYYSGDLGSVDPAGYVYISDRRKDLIVSGGMNIYPAELELSLAKLPGVKECAVVGMPHPRWGQSPVVAVVRATGFNLSEHDVIDFMVAHLASYKKPQRVLFFDDLPRNTSNKLMKHLVREMVAARLSAEQPSPRR
jgi:acyl-CoA synthetase (AMP-forming)/AMP-acid ligase II